MGLKVTRATAEILEVLADGRATPGYLQRETDLSRNTIHGQLNSLLAADAIEYVDEPTGLYELVNDPREDVEPDPDPDALQERIGELESDLQEAREDVEHYKTELSDCQSKLEDVPDRQQISYAISELETACERGDGNGVEVALGRLREAAGLDDE